MGVGHDDLGLNQKLVAGEQFYNLNRPHAALDGKTPYEILRFLLNKLLISPIGYGGPQ